MKHSLKSQCTDVYKIRDAAGGPALFLSHSVTVCGYQQPQYPFKNKNF